MEMVSASKMRQAQLQAFSSRVYSRKLNDILTQIATFVDTSHHPLLRTHTDSPTEAILIISTDRGLTGSLNTNLFKSISDYTIGKDIKFFTIGKLAREFTLKAGYNLQAEFGDVKDSITYETAVPIAQLLINRFLAGTFSSVSIAYMDFISTLSQKPSISPLLPIQKQTSLQSEKPLEVFKEYLFEPSPQSILNSLLPYFIELTIYQFLLEARASEHSARMVAMKNASDNASDLVGNLELEYNRSRQAFITSELADIVTASLTIGGKS